MYPPPHTSYLICGEQKAEDHLEYEVGLGHLDGLLEEDLDRMTTDRRTLLILFHNMLEILRITIIFSLNQSQEETAAVKPELLSTNYFLPLLSAAVKLSNSSCTGHNDFLLLELISISSEY